MIAELVAQGKIKHALTANGKTLAENCKGKFSDNRKVILPFAKPMQKKPASSISRATCLTRQSRRVRRRRGKNLHRGIHRPVNPQDELKTGTFHAMCAQLGIRANGL